MLTRDFYLRNGNVVAPELLGKKLIHDSPEGITEGIIVEVESYIGPLDKDSHAFQNKRTPRTEVQFGMGGYAYIYTIYGLHSCFNVVTNHENCPEVVLVRALEPANGIELMKKRRKTQNLTALCNGPGKLCQAMGITKHHYGYDLCNSTLRIESGLTISPSQILVSPRINIDYAEECTDFMWRYFLGNNKFVSQVPARYKTTYALYK